MKTQAEILHNDIVDLNDKVDTLDQKIDDLGGSVNNTVSVIIDRTDEMSRNLSSTIDHIREIDENVAGIQTDSSEVLNAINAQTNTMKDWNLDKIYSLLQNLSNYISSDISTIISSDISSDISTIISSDTDILTLEEALSAIDNLYPSDMEFFTDEEINNAVQEYESENGEIALSAESELLSQSRGSGPEIFNKIYRSFIDGQNDRVKVSLKFEHLDTYANKIDTIRKDPLPKFDDVLTDELCDPTNTYIEKVGDAYATYRGVIEKAVNYAKNTDTLLEFIGYASGLNDSSGDIEKIIKTIKFIKINENNLDYQIISNSANEKIQTGYKIFEYPIEKEERSLIEKRESPYQAASQLYMQLQHISVEILGGKPYCGNIGPWSLQRLTERAADLKGTFDAYNTSTLRIATNSRFYSRREVVEFLTQLKTNLTTLAQFKEHGGQAYQNLKQITSQQVKQFKVLADEARWVYPSLTNIFRQFSAYRQQAIAAGMSGFGLSYFGAVGAWFGSLLGLGPVGGSIILAILIILAVIALIAIFSSNKRDATNATKKAIKITNTAVKNFIKACDSMHNEAKAALDPAWGNVLKDLNHHARYYTVIFNNELSEEVLFGESPSDEFKNRCIDFLKKDYRYGSLDELPSENVAIFYDDMLTNENFGISTIDGAFSLASQTLPTQTFYINAYLCDFKDTCPICGKPIGDEDDDYCIGYDAHEIQYEIAEFHGPIKLWIDYENQVEYEGPGKEIEDAIGWSLANAYTIIDGEKVYLPEYDKYGTINGSDVPMDEWDLDSNSLKTVTFPSETELTTTSGSLAITIHIDGWKKCGSNDSVIEPGAKYTLSDDEVHEHITSGHNECVNCESRGVLNFEIVGSIDID